MYQTVVAFILYLNPVHPQETCLLIKPTCAGVFTPNSQSNYISIAGYCFDPNTELPAISDELKEASTHYLIQFKGPVYESMKKTVESYGAKLIQYVPSNVFIARIADSISLGQIKTLPFVRWVGGYEPAFKLSPLFHDLKNEDRVLVMLFNGESRDKIEIKLNDMQCEILKGYGCDGQTSDIIMVKTQRATLEKIIRLPEVMYVEPFLAPVILNENAQWVMQTNQIGDRRVWRKGIRGQGQTINTTDTGVLTSHDMFYDPVVPITTWGDYPAHRKIISYKTWSGSSAEFGDNAVYGWHGTHTACTACGDDSSVGGQVKCDGLALRSNLYFMDIGPNSGGLSIPANLISIYQPPYQGNAGGHARISSHSWGVAVSGAYIDYCRQTDQFMWNNKDFLICFGVGSGGPGSNTVSAPATSKNVISVGSVYNSMNANKIAPFSARGPCDDGRIKPTIVVPCNLVSAMGPGSNDYRSLTGTSSSTPCAAGGAALVRTYFIRGFYPTGDSTVANEWSYISAALLKACIINSASAEIEGIVIPDNNGGWGRVQLDDVLYFAGDVRKLAVWDDTQGVATGEYREYQVAVNNQSEPLKITLVWTDYPGIEGANPAIVNNLDLLVIGPNNDEYHGNQYSGGQSIPNPSTWDSINVEENVRRNVPELGTWTIRINGMNVPQGTKQPYAIVVTGGLGPVAEPALHICGYHILDEWPGGNHNQVIEPGETVGLVDTLQNLSGVGVTNCLGVLRVSSPFVTLIDTIGDFGNIPIEAKGSNDSSKFVFSVSDTTPVGTFIPFMLHMTGGSGYVQDIGFDLEIGIDNAIIVWGPKQLYIPAGDTHYVYGLGYSPADDQLYVCNYYESKIYKYSSDSNVTYLGEIPAPDTCPTDIKYCQYDNTYWIAADPTQSAPAGKMVFKTDTAGNVLRQFNNPANDYPVGLAWIEAQRSLYLSDRMSGANLFPQYIYRSDTLGSFEQLSIPLQGFYGARCLAIDLCGPDTTLLMVYTWYDSIGYYLDSAGIYELRRSDLAVVKRCLLPGWSATGIEYDPRDGNYWVTIAKNPNRSIVKIIGFNGYYPPNQCMERPANPEARVEFVSGIPNPFSKKMKIIYSLKEETHVFLNIYDVAGRLVRKLVDAFQRPGVKMIEWDGRSINNSHVASGIYFCCLETKQGVLVKKIIFAR